MTVASHDRHVPFETAWNFRDLGGYRTGDGRRTRWRTLFRADGVHRLGVDELRPLGIRTVVDLRTPGELSERGRFEHDSVRWHHLPMFDELWEASGLELGGEPHRFLADRYADMLDTGRAAVPAVLALVADPGALPLVFHCAAGKDRTGVIAALLLSLLGVDDDTIVEDYVLSQMATDKLVEWLERTYPDKLDEIRNQPTAFMSSPAEAMRLFLDELRAAHGSTGAYVRSLGVGDDAVAAVRANLLEPADG